jgi:predicted GH43/DUF377 family glycosyl hydrolase
MMRDIIRELSLKALKRFANGGDGPADLLMQIEDLRKTLEIRAREHEEHLTEVREERDHWLAQYDEVKFAAEFLMSYAKNDVPKLAEQTDWEVGKIVLPHETGTYYFNPAIMQEADGRIMLFTRRCRNKREKDEEVYVEKNDIVAFELSKDLRATKKSILQLTSNYPNEQFEDPRVVKFGDKYGLSCCTFVPFKSYAHQAMFLVDKQFLNVGRFDPIYGNNYAQAMINDGHEKNWLFFVHDNAPHMVYSANPHVVVRLNGRLEKESEYVTEEFNPLWKFGEVRGGTNPIYADGLYWTFFHSSLPWINGKRRYYMGAYAFEAKAPFRIARMTTLPLLTGTNQQDWWPGLPAVVFPCGAFFDSAKNNFVISYGINDVDCGYMKLPLADLLEVTKVIRPKRDVVNKEKPLNFTDVLDPIPERHKLKRNQQSKYNELAKRLDEEPEQTSEAGPTESA